uniref:Uncharacterized protein n=1 Tax=Pseudomonas phage RVTF4 TaxID=3236931 RepID=A0AB39CDC0_9VIRU
MYTKLPALTEAQVEDLLKLQTELKMTDAVGHRVRIGANAPNKMSKYSYSRWFSWTRHQRALYKSIIPEHIVSRSLQCWFLKFDPVVGFLDEMTVWVGKASSGTVIAYALQDGMSITLDNGHRVHVPKGEGISFHLSTVHEVPPTKQGGLWACVMIRGCHSTCQHEPK